MISISFVIYFNEKLNYSQKNNKNLINVIKLKDGSFETFLSEICTFYL